MLLQSSKAGAAKQEQCLVAAPAPAQAVQPPPCLVVVIFCAAVLCQRAVLLGAMLMPDLALATAAYVLETGKNIRDRVQFLRLFFLQDQSASV